MATETIIQDNHLSASLITQAARRKKSRSNPFIRIGFTSANNIEIDQNIRSNKIPLEVISKLSKELDLNEQQVYSLVNISSSTISRRKKEGKGLKPDEAGRVYRIAAIISLAESTLGDHERSIRWLKTPAKFLGGAVPLELLETEAGTDEVRNLLLRIEHSVYS